MCAREITLVRKDMVIADIVVQEDGSWEMPCCKCQAPLLFADGDVPAVSDSFESIVELDNRAIVSMFYFCDTCLKHEGAEVTKRALFNSDNPVFHKLRENVLNRLRKDPRINLADPAALARIKKSMCTALFRKIHQRNKENQR